MSAEHKAAVTLANSLIHVMGNFAEKSPFEKRDGLRLPGEYDPLIEKGVANFTWPELEAVTASLPSCSSTTAPTWCWRGTAP